MPILNSIASWFSYKRLSEIDLFKENPVDTQLEVLKNLVTKAKGTAFGREHRFGDMKSEEDFQKQVPVRTYEELSPYIDRLLRGEKDVLWPGTIKWFAKSSGTTNDKSKFIPVSKESLDDVHYRGFKDVLALYLKNNPASKILTGKSLTLGGSHQINSLNKESFYGDLSAILIENAPFGADLIRIPKAKVALIEEFEEKLDQIIKSAKDENIASIAGVPSWNLVMLQRMLEATGKPNISELWPDLEIFFHGGINFDPYREQYKAIIPSNNMHYMETYNASEGFFAIQDELHRDDMLLILDLGVYYEFIDMEDYYKENPTVHTLETVELGKNYALIISTNGGLWRYAIGDTIKFTDLSPFRIKITGRTKHFINAFGEEVIIDNAEAALRVACESTGAHVKEYTAGPIFMEGKEKGSHEWVIEFSKQPDDLNRFTDLLDKEIQRLNSDYEAKRHNNTTLNAPTIVVAREGLFYDWMKQRGKVGGQNKIPRLANDRTYIEQLLTLQ